jgi:C-terminal peptidase prc
MVRAAAACVIIVVLAWVAPAPAAAQASINSCSTVGKNLRVRDVMSDIYLWYAEMPNLDPAGFNSPEAYLEAVRYMVLDSHFSYISSREANRAFFGESQYVGLGVSWSVRGDELRVLQVFPDSPASEAGLTRGDRIDAIGGVPAARLIATNSIGEAVGDEVIGLSVRVDFTGRDGVARGGHLAKRVVTIPTVSLTRTFDVQGRRVGYIFFRNFVQPSFAALDEAFAQLASARVHDLVLDLRYNGGGLVSVAQHLASVVGGARTRGQVFAEYFHNDKNAHRNQAIRFEDKANAINLERLIVITTPSSASASELVINALRPFIPVVVIGDRTYGKPVGQYQIEFCDKMLAPVSFSLRNAHGQGDFFDGFAPDCAAADDVDHQLGDAEEASLREALFFAAAGRCRIDPTTMQRTQTADREMRSVGWRSVLNAY